MKFITKLRPNEVFVFGSNLSGRHGKGAAKCALKWGAKWGVGNGQMGQTYAIPTKSISVQKTLPLNRIQIYVTQFLDWAKMNPDLTFLVTEIGCGLAGYKPKDIAPMFIGYTENVILPESFLRYQ